MAVATPPIKFTPFPTKAKVRPGVTVSPIGYAPGFETVGKNGLPKSIKLCPLLLTTIAPELPEKIKPTGIFDVNNGGTV